MLIDNELLQEAAKFLKIPEDDLEKCFKKIDNYYKGYTKWQHLTEKEWLDTVSTSDLKSIYNFYSTTENYIPECIEYHSGEKKKRLVQSCVNLLIENNCKTVLDFGCGIGQDSIKQNEAGLTACACDIPGLTFDFAKWRFTNRNLDIHTIDIEFGESPKLEQYDAITCFEVLQHVPNLISTINLLFDALNNDGILLLTARFINNYKLALDTNAKYHDNLCIVLQELGLTLVDKIPQWGSGDTIKYLEIYRK